MPTPSLIEWLKATGNCNNVVACEVILNRRLFSGAVYNDRTTGDKRFYLLGELPKALHHRVCYPMGEYEWYLSAYIKADKITDANRQFHPFGANFILSAWNVAGKIDDHERTPYKRLPIEVAVY